MKVQKKVLGVIYRVNTQGGIEILALKKHTDTSKFWQPVTGRLEYDENFEQALKREMLEETGLDVFDDIIDLEQQFEFEGREMGEPITFVEKAYAVRIQPHQPITFENNPTVEHVDYIWISYDGAFELFDFPHQKDALNKIYRIHID